MSNLLGFTPVFDMETSLFLWYLLWLCLCTPKFYPTYFYPKYSKHVFFHSRPWGWNSLYSKYAARIMHIYIYLIVCVYTYVSRTVHVFICLRLHALAVSHCGGHRGAGGCSAGKVPSKSSPRWRTQNESTGSLIIPDDTWWYRNWHRLLYVAFRIPSAHIQHYSSTTFVVSRCGLEPTDHTR